MKYAPNVIYILADDMGYGDISALNEHFFVCDYDVKAITEAIAKISDGEFQVLDLK